MADCGVNRRTLHLLRDQGQIASMKGSYYPTDSIRTKRKTTKSRKEPRASPWWAAVPVSAMRHGRLWYEAADGSSLRYAVLF